MNKRCCQYLGYEPFEAIGKNLLDIFPEENKLEIINNAVRCLLEGRTGDYEINIKRKDGTLLPVRVRSSPITENKYVIGGLVLCEDITEHVRIKQEMARLAQLHMVGEIAAGIGHEIRNPMTTVQGFLQLLSHNEELAKFSSYFDLMLEELERANGIISEFLSLAGNKMANFQRININHIVNSIYPLLQADATVDDKEIRFIPGTINEILLDEKEIRQLILNLVRNGLEAMSAGGRVTISTEQMYDKVRLSVRDEGPGIDPAVMEKMGTPFFTTKDNGTGLGLAVCYGIIARHQATLDVQTGPRGTTFNIDFKLNMDMDA
jgi:two-component system, sporulation sensor kinase E